MFPATLAPAHRAAAFDRDVTYCAESISRAPSQLSRDVALKVPRPDVAHEDRRSNLVAVDTR